MFVMMADVQLKKRFAKGEISKEEYEEMKLVLE
ncbi:MAG: SHOCT domain-containing protein [Nitrosopumilus sp.]